MSQATGHLFLALIAVLTVFASAPASADDSEISIKRPSNATSSSLARSCGRDADSALTQSQLTVNPLNQAQVLEDIYVSGLNTGTTDRGFANIKKFKFRGGLIVGRGKEPGANALDSSGLLIAQVPDFWSPDSNASSSEASPVTSRIASGSEPRRRNVYTYIGEDSHPNKPVPLSQHPFVAENSAISAGPASLDLGAGDPDRDQLINWVRGDLATIKYPDLIWSAPAHSRPTPVVYASESKNDSERLSDAVVYAATNDGSIHAIDANTGKELWAYIPQELFSSLKMLFTDNTKPATRYLLDGEIQVLRYDADGNGSIEHAGNDRVFIYFSQGRGGDNYFALDVTDKYEPKFLWSLDGKTDLNGIVRKSWSTPMLGRVLVGNGSRQNAQKLVLIFGGGHDGSDEPMEFSRSGNAHGNAIFMVDAVNGKVLWHQTRTPLGAFAKMTHAIPSSVTVLDTNRDGWSDRIYVGDTAGQVWRMDITNGNAGNIVSGQEKSALVAGGVIASLGGKATPGIENNRQFYNAPDIAKIVSRNSSSFYNVAIGSGDHIFPRSNLAIDDRFYAIRDYHLDALTQAQFDTYVPTTDSGNTGVKTIDGSEPVGKHEEIRGWKVVLSRGEKVLTTSFTINAAVMFTSYVPGTQKGDCTMPSNLGRAYALKVATGLKNFPGLYESFQYSGLSSELRVFGPKSPARTDGSPAPPNSESAKTSSCWAGLVKLQNCIDFGSRTKSFWQEGSMK